MVTSLFVSKLIRSAQLSEFRSKLAVQGRYNERHEQHVVEWKSIGRVAHIVELVGDIAKVGAPSFAQFAKGGYGDACARGSKPPTRETKSLPTRISRERLHALARDRNGNYSRSFI